MTPEERIAKIDEQLLVQAELVARFERETKERLALHEDWLAHHHEQLKIHAVEMAEYRTTVTRVLDLLERFVSGQSGGDGQGSRP